MKACWEKKNDFFSSFCSGGADGSELWLLQAPLDQLDFAMKGQYDHHGELLKSRAEVLMQAETLGKPHG